MARPQSIPQVPPVGRGILGWIVLAACGLPSCKTTFTVYEDVEEDTPSDTGGSTGTGGEQGGGQGGQGGEPGPSPNPGCDDHECAENFSCDIVDEMPTCVCDAGYELEGESCVDIDECAEDNGGCHEHATCENLPGSHTCTCTEGYVGDGEWCQPLTALVSVGLHGEPGDGDSPGGGTGVGVPSISADGRYVAFASLATNLVEGDSNGFRDVFVRDMREGTTVRVSVSSSGAQGNNHSTDPSISADGRYVAFMSEASNLVPNDNNSARDIFVHDLEEKTTRRIVNRQGVEGSGPSEYPRISADGNFVAFASSATNLSEAGSGILVHDLTRGFTDVASMASSGETADGGAPSISSDGRYVGYFTSSSALLDAPQQFKLIVTDTAQTPPQHTLAGTSAGGQCGQTSVCFVLTPTRATDLSGNGQVFVWRNPSGGGIFVRDLQTSSAVRVDLTSSGAEPDHGGETPVLSFDGRFVAFSSTATNLVAGDTNEVADVFVRDRQEGVTRRVSVGPQGAQGNAASLLPAISSDGQFVAFTSASSSFGHPGGTQQVYIRALLTE